MTDIEQAQPQAPQPGHQPSRRQMVMQLREIALTGDWEEVLEANTRFLERFPHDAEALNRKGRALLELARLQEAWDAYSEALNADPANMIARRNLQRLEMLANAQVPMQPHTEPTPAPRAGVFVEEVGKTWVDELTRATEDQVLATVSPGEQLTFSVEGAKVLVSNRSGAELGELDQRIAHRLIDLIEAGNRYEMYALGMSGHSLRFILREVYQNPAQAGRLGLPRQNRVTNELMRERELLSQRDEADFSFGEEGEELPEQDNGEEHTIDEEAAAYVDPAATQDEDEDNDM